MISRMIKVLLDHFYYNIILERFTNRVKRNKQYNNRRKERKEHKKLKENNK